LIAILVAGLLNKIFECFLSVLVHEEQLHVMVFLAIDVTLLLLYTDYTVAVSALSVYRSL